MEVSFVADHTGLMEWYPGDPVCGLRERVPYPDELKIAISKANPT